MDVLWCDMVLERTWTWTPFVFRLGSPVECLGRRPDILERNAIVEPCVDNLEVKLVRHDTQSWGYAREYLSTSRSKVTQTPDDPASDNLLEILVWGNMKRWNILSLLLTVEAIAAGTFAIIDITGLRSRSMKVYKEGLALRKQDCTNEHIQSQWGSPEI